jgi:hypothetical protein
VLLVLCGKARAEPASAVLAWSGGDYCASPVDIEAKLARLTGAPVGDARFQAQVSKAGQTRYKLELRSHVHGQNGFRSLEHDSCAALQDASLLLMAIALDPALQEVPVEPLAPSQASAGPTKLQLGFSIAGLFDARSLPAVSAGGGVGAALDVRGARLSLEARGLVPRSLAGLPEGGSAQLGLWAGALGLAYRFQLGPVWLGPMLQLELGSLQLRATGVPEVRDINTLWAAGAAGAACELSLTSHWRLALNMLGSIPFTRPRFGLIGAPPNFTVPPAALRITFGIEFWFAAVD